MKKKFKVKINGKGPIWVQGWSVEHVDDGEHLPKVRYTIFNAALHKAAEELGTKWGKDATYEIVGLGSNSNYRHRKGISVWVEYVPCFTIPF